MKTNIGQKLQTIAMLFGVLGTIFALYIAIDTYNTGGRYLGRTVLIGVLIALPAILIISMLVYAFGELVDTAISIRSAMNNTDVRLNTIEGHVKKLHLAQKVRDEGVQLKTEDITSSAKKEEIENTCPADVSSFLEKAKMMNSASEIARAFEEEYGVDNNESTQEMLRVLQKDVKNERIYGNMKTSAVRNLEKFFRYNMTIFKVDRYDDSIKCPICKEEQKSDRSCCISCGALFFQ